MPCSSWVFINSATSRRTRLDPLGDESKNYVLLANQLLGDHVSRPKRLQRLRICARVAVLLLVALSRSVYFGVEQPASTKLFLTPYFQHIEMVCEKLGIRFYNVFLSEAQLVVS